MFEPQVEKSIEKYLVMNFFPSRMLYADDLKELGIPEIEDFIRSNQLPISFEGTRHFRKENLINAIAEQLSQQEFDKYYRRYRANYLIKNAKTVKINYEYLAWEPEFKCRAFLEFKDRDRDFTISISIFKGRIAHSDCDWESHHNVFCFHLFALFMDLAKQNYTKTMDFLQEYKT
jgi:hypothetical protein